jgi:hypothetical protein
MALDDAKNEFELALNEVESNLEFLSTSARLRPRLNPLVNWALLAEDHHSKTLVEDFLRQKEVVLTPQYRGMTVIISGAFEQLIRRIIEAAIIAFSASKNGFDSLPHGIRVQNVVRTGRALTKFQEPLDHAPLDHQLLVERLVSCHSKSEKFELNHEVFSYFVSNLTSRHLEEVLGWIDVSLNWDDIGRNKEIESFLGTKGAKQSGKAAAEFLNKVTKLRNNVAHVGVSGLTVTETDVKSFLKFFRIFAACITDLVARRIKGL